MKKKIKKGKFYEVKEVVTVNLMDAIKKLLGTENEVRWSNVPQNHSDINPEVRKLIYQYQQKILLVQDYERMQKESKKENRITKLQQIIERFVFDNVIVLK